MKFLIPEDELGVFADQGGVPRVDSLFVADVFDKQHFHVLRDIAKRGCNIIASSKKWTQLSEPIFFKQKRPQRASLLV